MMSSQGGTGSEGSTQVGSQPASAMDNDDNHHRRRSAMYRRESNMSECVLSV